MKTQFYRRPRRRQVRWFPCVLVCVFGMHRSFPRTIGTNVSRISNTKFALILFKYFVCVFALYKQTTYHTNNTPRVYFHLAITTSDPTTARPPKHIPQGVHQTTTFPRRFAETNQLSTRFAKIESHRASVIRQLFPAGGCVPRYWWWYVAVAVVWWFCISNPVRVNEWRTFPQQPKASATSLKRRYIGIHFLAIQEIFCVDGGNTIWISTLCHRHIHTHDWLSAQLPGGG